MNIFRKFHQNTFVSVAFVSPFDLFLKPFNYPFTEDSFSKIPLNKLDQTILQLLTKKNIFLAHFGIEISHDFLFFKSKFCNLIL